MIPEKNSISEQDRYQTTKTEVVRLKEALRASESIIQAQQEFLTRLTHLIRLPLYSQLGLIRSLQKSTCSTPQAEYVQLMQANTKELLAALNNLYAFNMTSWKTTPGS